MSGVDVSICALTYRRPGPLARLLDSLARLKRPSGAVFEIVLVDNDPAGSAFAAADRATHAGEWPVRWEHEPSGDTSRARNRAVAAARGHWIAWIDDDETAHEPWLAAYLETAERHPADGYFGPVLPRLEEPRDSWLEVERFYGRPRAATGAPADLPRTSNGFVRRSLQRELGFDLAFGRSFGEDTECFFRARDRGARFVWCDEACVDEFLPPARHRPGYLMRRHFEVSTAWARLLLRRSRTPRWLRLAESPVRLLAALALLPSGLLGGRAALFEGWLRVCREAGRLVGFAGATVARTPS